MYYVEHGLRKSVIKGVSDRTAAAAEASMVQREHLVAFLAVVAAFPAQYYLRNNFGPISHPQHRIQGGPGAGLGLSKCLGTLTRTRE